MLHYIFTDHTSKPHTSKNSMQSERCNSLKQKSDIVSTKVSNMNQMPTVSALSNKQPYNHHKHGWLKINSVLARKILKAQQKIDIQTGQKMQQMVSVLKKPPNPSPNNTKQCSLPNNMKESIMTTTSRSNDEIQNIIQQDTQDTQDAQDTQDTQENMPSQNKQKPVRKIGLKEYREKQRLLMDSNDKQPVVRKKVIYIYNASTMTTSSLLEGSSKTEDNKDWSIREIDTVVILETENKETKKEFRDAFSQTYETIFEFSGNSTENEKDSVAEGTNER